MVDERFTLELGQIRSFSESWGSVSEYIYTRLRNGDVEITRFTRPSCNYYPLSIVSYERYVQLVDRFGGLGFTGTEVN